ncbi:hypothetical protein [Jiulongibacter sediminis]|uniref:hypothetical protein n=1 Tax=Jiulongibacter sediminis TaxID=1605367 RepID=UPI0026EC9ABC|nr:hypothetical protein [Jiulongibacter sediminis]
MTKIKLIIIIALLIYTTENFGQRIILKPTVNNNIHSKNFGIASVELTDDETLIKVQLSASYNNTTFKFFEPGSPKAFFLEDESGNKIASLESIIGLGPNKVSFKNYKSSIMFTLKFSPIPEEIKTINLIEGSKKGGRFFNLYGIDLSEGGFFSTSGIASYSSIIKYGILSTFLANNSDQEDIKSFVIEPLGLNYDEKNSSEGFDFFIKTRVQNPSIIESIALGIFTNEDEISSMIVHKKNSDQKNHDLNSSFMHDLKKDTQIVLLDGNYVFVVRDKNSNIRYSALIDPEIYSEHIKVSFYQIENQNASIELLLSNFD